MKQGLQRLLETVRGKRWMRRPLSKRSVSDRAEWVPHDDTGWTVHRDVALRMRNRRFEEPAITVPDPGSRVGAFKIRVAGPSQARRDAGSLVQQLYARRGYRTAATVVNESVCTFAAYDEGRLAGTVSLRLDSKDGLAADGLYRAEIDMLRARKHRICEFTRLAVDASRVSKPVLAGLFHTVYLFAREVRGFDFVVIEVNPRHVGYYRRSLGFEVIGPERHNERVDAPAVLMGVSFAAIGENLHHYAHSDRHAAASRTLYVHGFSAAEEVGVLRRLQRLDAR